MLLGYNTNGFPHHGARDALEVIAGLGYRAVGLTLDHHFLNPFSPHISGQVREVEGWLQRLGLEPVVETGARFLLDPWAKHEPTLISPDPAGRVRRLDFLLRAVDIAAALGAKVVSLWSGTLHEGVDPTLAEGWLIEGLSRVVDHGAERGVVVGFEPEPGMFIDDLRRFFWLCSRLPALRLTLDVGHALCTEAEPPERIIPTWRDMVVNVHLEDMMRGVHRHLMPGEGEMDLAAVVAALEAVGYGGPACVELSGHGHDAVNAARKAMAFFQDCLKPRK